MSNFLNVQWQVALSQIKDYLKMSLSSLALPILSLSLAIGLSYVAMVPPFFRFGHEVWIEVLRIIAYLTAVTNLGAFVLKDDEIQIDDGEVTETYAYANVSVFTVFAMLVVSLAAWWFGVEIWIVLIVVAFQIAVLIFAATKNIQDLNVALRHVSAMLMMLLGCWILAFG